MTDKPGYVERVFRSRVTKMYAKSREREQGKDARMAKAAAKRLRKAAKRRPA
jgi:hypothetical protein